MSGDCRAEGKLVCWFGRGRQRSFCEIHIALVPVDMLGDVVLDFVQDLVLFFGLHVFQRLQVFGALDARLLRQAELRRRRALHSGEIDGPLFGLRGVSS